MLQCTRLQRTGHDLATEQQHSLFLAARKVLKPTLAASLSHSWNWYSQWSCYLVDSKPDVLSLTLLLSLQPRSIRHSPASGHLHLLFSRLGKPPQLAACIALSSQVAAQITLLTRLSLNILFKNHKWTFLVVQYIRICLTMQGTRAQSQVQKHPTCPKATKPVCHND